jgi:hypothetical protein
MKYDPRAARGHIESWFLKANDPLERSSPLSRERADSERSSPFSRERADSQRRALWLRWTIWAGAAEPRPALAEAWAIAFGSARGHVATKSSLPFERARFSREDIDIDLDGCTLTPRAARGRVESGGRSIEYDLSIESRAAPMSYLLARWMYEGAWPRQKLVSPNPDARVTGTVKVDGEPWQVEGWPAMIGHTWGQGHSPVYAWGNCNAWDGGDVGRSPKGAAASDDVGRSPKGAAASDDVVLDGFSVRLKTGPVLLPTMTLLCLHHHGVRYDLRGPAGMVRNRGQVSLRRWRFQARGDRAEVHGEMWADTDDFVGLFYPNPDGTQLYCLNSKIARAEVTIQLEGRAPRTLRSSRAALEIMTSDPHHGVRMYV